MNGILTSYPFAPRNPMSNASIVGNPKTVREWANKKGSDFSKAFTDATITSSLMKKAQETAMNLKETAEDESNREHLRASVLASQLSQEALPNLPMMRDELLGYLDAAQSPAL
jgi:maltose-binding protein MalE